MACNFYVDKVLFTVQTVSVLPTTPLTVCILSRLHVTFILATLLLSVVS